MTDGTAAPQVGWQVVDRDGAPMGRVDGAFADYLLVRTRGLMPVDLYIPSNAILESAEATVKVDGTLSEARMLWGRPLRRAPHETSER